MLRPDVIATISDFWVARARIARRLLLVFIPYFIAWYILVLITSNPYVVFIGGVPIFIAEITVFFRISRSGGEGFAAARIFGTIAKLENNPSRWQTSAFRWDIARRIELAAKSIERIPLRLKSVAPSVKRQIFAASRAKAQAIRELQLWAIQPGPFTFTDLVHQLSVDLDMIAHGRWYDLPEAPELQRQTPRWITAAEIIGSIAIAAAGVAILVYSAKVGPASAVVAPILFGGALALLSAAGVPAGMLERYAGMANKLSSQG